MNQTIRIILRIILGIITFLITIVIIVGLFLMSAVVVGYWLKLVLLMAL